jgi:hypothetical protein
MSELTAAALDDRELVGAEVLLEGLAFAGDALANLGRLAVADIGALGIEAAWRARVTLDGTVLLIVADEGRWSILAPAGGDVGDAMMAARRLHGILGTAAEGWDLDR